MRLALVVGQVVSTVKEPGLDSLTLLVVRDLDPTAVESGRLGQPYVTVDLIGAGEKEIVVIASGSAARVQRATAATSTDSAAVAIVDNVVIGGTEVLKE